MSGTDRCLSQSAEFAGKLVYNVTSHFPGSYNFYTMHLSRCLSGIDERTDIDIRQSIPPREYYCRCDENLLLDSLLSIERWYKVTGFY